MKKTVLPVSFFLGANNKAGYYSLFGEIYNPFEMGNHIILKGGPGTGKSTLMKKIAAKAEGNGYFTERDYCSADPDSLDAVVVPEINFSIYDGTAPHTFDPKMPGVSEHIVDLGAAWNRKKLQKHINEIGQLMQENALQHKRVAEFLRVAAQIENESAAICLRLADEEKLERFVRRLAHRAIPERKGVAAGKTQKRLLSAVSPVGVTVQHDTVVALAENIVTIEDEFSAVAPFIMEYIGAVAIRNGYDIYQCYCPLQPGFKIEHIIIPELKLALFTEKSYHCSIDDGEKIIHASRFYNKDMFKANKEKLTLQKKAKKELVDEAIKKLVLAKSIHDRLEDYYIDATNFAIINEIGEKVLDSVR